jgi:hypothetical protein
MVFMVNTVSWWLNGVARIRIQAILNLVLVLVATGLFALFLDTRENPAVSFALSEASFPFHIPLLLM